MECIRSSLLPADSPTDGIGAELSRNDEGKFFQSAEQAGLQTSTGPHLGIHDLPSKVHLRIMSHSAPRDLLRLSQTDHRFRVLVERFEETNIGAQNADLAMKRLWASGSRDPANPEASTVQIRDAYSEIGAYFPYLKEGLGDVLIQTTAGIKDPKVRLDAIKAAQEYCGAGFTESQNDTLLMGATTITDPSMRAEALMSFDIDRLTSTQQTKWAWAVMELPVEECLKVGKKCLQYKNTIANEPPAVLLLRRRIGPVFPEKARPKAPTETHLGSDDLPTKKAPAIEKRPEIKGEFSLAEYRQKYEQKKKIDAAAAAKRTIEQWLDPANWEVQSHINKYGTVDFSGAYREIGTHFASLGERGDALIQQTVGVADPARRRDAIRAAVFHCWDGLTEHQQDTLLDGAIAIEDPSLRVDTLSGFDLYLMTPTQTAKWARAAIDLSARHLLALVIDNVSLRHIVLGLDDETHGLLRRSIEKIDDPALSVDKEFALEDLGPDRSAGASR